MRSNSRKSRKKKKKERWNWDTQSKAVMTPMTEKLTFKKFLESEDWQDDVDEHGAGTGVCPKCGGEAHYTSSGTTPRNAESHWECQKCGHCGDKRKY